ncbi:cobalt-precorrin-6X reductase [Actibacterium mucosum KCTC 23349]|uniref:Cobalt-precorrin-6X reductase n=1 Tax=Actibacterium mucosum KCTC 23349 TaxID=1454373 RepID=A0A037ZK03_9RHOB|nr:cobalt-precorrin-6A reductase [Actibacterium mucosum]KAJ55176.1 cobalt-precorrin-6X reductase [Actibacterium mucosum KCTC 23349]
MRAKLLILGGTTEASALAQAVADAGLAGEVSLAGRVDRPRPLPLPTRIGGFGGVEGLAKYLQANAITHLVDATHPFAAQISANAIHAARLAGVPMVALTRAPWAAQAGDQWHHVPDMAGAVAALSGPARRVMLAIGRMHLADFAAQPQHFYLLRLVDPPRDAITLPDHHAEVSRGPFTVEGDMALLREHRIEVIVSKNSGGAAAKAKLDAARALGIGVIMINRPCVPDRMEVTTVEDLMAWLGHSGTDRGV